MEAGMINTGSSGTAIVHESFAPFQIEFELCTRNFYAYFHLNTRQPPLWPISHQARNAGQGRKEIHKS